MSFFSKLFGSEKKGTGYDNGPKPYGTLMEAAGGPEYYNAIKKRMGGEDVGYESGYVDKATNPILARMRNQFQSYDLPELKSELTATGRRAGSSGFQQIAKAYENQGLNEEAAYAPIYQAAQEARRQDINANTQAVGAFNQNDYNARNILANFEYNSHRDQVGDAQQRRANEARGLQALGQAGVQLLFGGSSPNPFNNNLLNYGGQNYPITQPPSNQQDYYTQMLSRLGQAGRVR